jgi:hypothetical protein
MQVGERAGGPQRASDNRHPQPEHRHQDEPGEQREEQHQRNDRRDDRDEQPAGREQPGPDARHRASLADHGEWAQWV